MLEHYPLTGSVIPFSRCWHIIDELDLVKLIVRHRTLAALCDTLEEVADALPRLPHRREVDRLCDTLDRLSEEGAGEESEYIRAMFAGEADDPLTAALLRRLRERQIADVACAEELRAALSPAGHEETPAPEILGYMLRCFFTACRQAMDLEELTILALAAKRLTPDARALLTDSLCSRLDG